jgi:hypothetical protein
MDYAASRSGIERIDPSIGPGTLTTRPVRFSGRHLFVNLDVPAGDLRVEVLDREARPLPGFSAAQCVAITGDHATARITWTGAGDLSAIAGQTVRFRFHLTGGSLYSFWVSPTEGGTSRGYVGSGGPGFQSTVDQSAANR